MNGTLWVNTGIYRYIPRIYLPLFLELLSSLSLSLSVCSGSKTKFIPLTLFRVWFFSSPLPPPAFRALSVGLSCASLPGCIVVSQFFSPSFFSLPLCRVVQRLSRLGPDFEGFSLFFFFFFFRIFLTQEWKMPAAAAFGLLAWAASMAVVAMAAADGLLVEASVPADADAPSLRELAANLGIFFGAAANAHEVRPPIIFLCFLAPRRMISFHGLCFLFFLFFYSVFFYHSFFCCVCCAPQLDGSAPDCAPYSSLLAAQYSLVTAENSCKWAATEPLKGQFNFSSCDAVLNW